MSQLPSCALIKYTTRVLCHNRLHLNLKCDGCSKCAINICKLCNHYSIYLHYLYTCSQCLNTFCIDHFITHSDLYVTIKKKGFNIDCSSHQISITRPYIYEISNKEHTLIADHAAFRLKLERMPGIDDIDFNFICFAYLKSSYIKEIGNAITRSQRQ